MGANKQRLAEFKETLAKERGNCSSDGQQRQNREDFSSARSVHFSSRKLVERDLPKERLAEKDFWNEGLEPKLLNHWLLDCTLDVEPDFLLPTCETRGRLVLQKGSFNEVGRARKVHFTDRWAQYLKSIPRLTERRRIR